MKYIYLSENSIEDISPLAKCENLRELYIDDNSVKSLLPIRNFKKLCVLDFLYQKPFIEDLTPLANIENLRIHVCNGEFDGNTASYKQINQRIKSGKAVSGIKQ